MEMIVKSDIKNDSIREITFAHICYLEQNTQMKY